MYPPHSSHEFVWYWNAGWFYVKNIKVSGVHDGLPKFVNKPPEELDRWSFVPTLAHFPILEKAARRISCVLTFPCFPLQLNSLAEEDFRTVLRVPVSGEAAEEDPEDDDEEEEQAPKKVAPRPTKRPRVRISGSEAGASGEASAKKSKTKPPPLDSKKAERERLNCCPRQEKGRARSFPMLRTRLPPPLRPTSKSLSRNTCRNLRLLVLLLQLRQAPLTQLPNLLRPELNLHPRPLPKLNQKLFQSTYAILNNAWGKPDAESSEIQNFKKEVGQFCDQLLCKRKVLPSASSSLTTASSELENLRSSYQDLEMKLAEAEQKRERAEKQLAEKNSELIKKEGEFAMKQKVDSDTLQKLQKEINGLQKYMDTAQKHRDLLNADVMEPLGYDEERRNQFPRDDLLQLAGDDCKDLISTCRKICHNLAIKKSRTCDVRKLIQRMDLLPELVVDLQASSDRGTAAMSLAMCLAHNPELDIDRVTSGVPPALDVNALLNAVSGYDTRIARRIRHDEFYDKVVLPADEPLEAELHKEREAETCPTRSGDGSQYTWTSSKEAKKGKSKDIAASMSEHDVESDDDDASSLPQDEEKGETEPNVQGCSPPTKK
ncbi:hypothetical protein QYE76_033783 [Lolium multiflorum]|uniref:Uncharacterized protein n=1 Tax=Lolium multiflorum TaxID=4521 RepID=A0AAD8QVX1_LOLMU|nr:hypothetical protein QYE76_033783 [Lolium multiflorum]